MVGYLNGTDRHFADPANEVSTHFGIGTRFEGGPVEISQYVNLKDTAWGNGNYDETGGWTLVKRRPDGSVINPNYYTVSIEYQDGSTDNRGVVTDEIKDAGAWLQSILLRGKPAELSAAGIRYDTATAENLANMPIVSERIIDHHRIAGRLKPYCWRPWLDDEGFLPWKTTLLPALKEVRMATLDELLVQLTAEVNRVKAEAATAKAAAEAANLARTAAEEKLAAAKVKATEISAL